MDIKISDYVSQLNNIWEDKCSNFDKLPNILPKVDRIIVIGDIHGDMKILIECLIVGKVINTKKEWIGGETIVVQVGDQIDSCRFDGINSCNDPTKYKSDKPHDIDILYFMTELHQKAVKKGGAVYSLLGNHEFMNVNSDMSYVSHSNITYLNNYKTDEDEVISDGMMARKHIFSPGNKIANFLACSRKTALIIGSNLFVHAGIVPYMTNKYNVDEINSLFSLFLLDELDKPKIFHDLFMSSKYSPLWTRIFGHLNHNNNKCNELLTPLKEIYQVGRIYVGHTPQLKTGIKSTCDDRIWLTDGGMSRSFDPFDYISVKSNGVKKSETRKAQVLEILNDGDISDEIPQPITVLKL